MFNLKLNYFFLCFLFCVWHSKRSHMFVSLINRLINIMVGTWRGNKYENKKRKKKKMSTGHLNGLKMLLIFCNDGQRMYRYVLCLNKIINNLLRLLHIKLMKYFSFVINIIIMVWWSYLSVLFFRNTTYNDTIFSVRKNMIIVSYDVWLITYLNIITYSQQKYKCIYM